MCHSRGVAHRDGDGWVECTCGNRHWGLNGAAGLLLVRDKKVLLQHRAPWVHNGDTWGIPGGARDSHETIIQAALREAHEEIGIEIDHIYWGQGYAKEAFSKAIDFIFEAYPVFRIQARAVPENTRSNHLLKSVGFNFEGTLKKACWYNRIYDLNYYGITRDTYRCYL